MVTNFDPSIYADELNFSREFIIVSVSRQGVCLNLVLYMTKGTVLVHGVFLQLRTPTTAWISVWEVQDRKEVLSTKWMKRVQLEWIKESL